MSEWHNEWPAKGLLRAYREAWAEIYRLRERVRELELLSQRAAGSGRAEESVEGAIKLGANPAVRATQNSAETPAEFPCLPHCGCDTTLMRRPWCQRADQTQEGGR